MQHSFDIEIAKKYGIEEAILLNNFEFWISKNKANNQNFYDGYYWTYNTSKALSELFPYMNNRQINYAIDNLIKEGLLIKGNYNKVGFDRTLWYTITEKGYSILQNCQMEDTKLSNANNKIVEPIPNNKQQIENTNNKPNKESKKDSTKSFDEIIAENFDNEKVKTELIEFIKMRKQIKKPMTNRALELLISKLKQMSNNNCDLMVKLLDQSIEHGWQTIYELKDNKTYQKPQQHQHLTIDYEQLNKDYAGFVGTYIGGDE